MSSQLHCMVANSSIIYGSRRGRDRMVVGFTTTCSISAYHHWSCEFEPCSWQGVLDTTLCDKVFRWLVTGQWFPVGTPLSSNYETDHHNITEILLKVPLNTISQSIGGKLPKISYGVQVKLDFFAIKLKCSRKPLLTCCINIKLHGHSPLFFTLKFVSKISGT